MSFETPGDQENRGDIHEEARRRAEEFIGELDPDLLVAVEHTNAVFADEEDKTPREISLLAFSHRLYPKVRWEMMLGDVGEEYFQGKFESVVRKIYTENMDVVARGESGLPNTNIAETTRESGVSSVLAVNEAIEKLTLDHFKKKFENQKVSELEREKKPEEIEIIQDITHHMKEYVRSYGGVPIELRPEHFHFLDRDKLTTEQRDFLDSELSDAHFYMRDQLIVNKKDTDNLVELAGRLVHEMLHFNSFQSYQVDSEGFIEARRNGFVASSRHEGDAENIEPYFKELNEAITEELAINFDSNYFESVTALKRQLDLRNLAIEHAPAHVNKTLLTDVSSAEIVMKEGKEQVILHQNSYYRERKKLKDLVTDLSEKNRKDFNSSEEVFNLFARAYFDGNFLPIARLVERTYGKESFRLMAKDFKGFKIS